MLKRYNLLILLVALGSGLKAQVNLVPNSGLELYDTCPDLSSQISYALDWFNPNLHSPDYHNSCSPSLYYSTPVNFMGNQSPRSGSAYAGIGIACYNGTREYLEVKLNDSLVSGTTYYIEFFASLSDSSNYATDDLGAYFSTSQVFNNSLDSIGLIPQVSNPSGNLIIDKNNWVKIAGYYSAQGGEKYVTIGNFKGSRTTDSTFLGNGGSMANPNFTGCYIYIDDVMVVDSNSIGIKEHSSEALDDVVIEYYPEYIILKSLNQKLIDVTFTNVMGQLIFKTRLEARAQVLIPCNKPHEMYILKYTCNNGTKIKKIIK